MIPWWIFSIVIVMAVLGIFLMFCISYNLAQRCADLEIVIRTREQEDQEYREHAQVIDSQGNVWNWSAWHDCYTLTVTKALLPGDIVWVRPPLPPTWGSIL